MLARVFHDDQPHPRTRQGIASCVVLMLTLSIGLEGRAFGAGEIRATAAMAFGRDPSSQKAAATATALLRQRIQTAQGLRLIEPAQVLSGDPRTREEETLERARTALADGRRDYDALALDDAIARLGQAVSLYQRTGPLLGDLDELATALAYLGAALILRGSADEGESTFVELLTISPNYQLGDFPPAVTRIFDRAVQRVDRAAAGSVEVYSTPPYAAVFVDGRYAGVTPLVLKELVAGTHYVRLEKLGYTVHGAPLEVASNQRITSQTRLRSIQRGVELRDLAARAVAEVPGDGMGGALRTIARTLIADTLIFIAVSQSGRDASFTGGVFDGTSGTRLATQRVVLAVDKPSFERDLGRYLDALIAAARGESTAGTAAAQGRPSGTTAESGAFGLAENQRPPEAAGNRTAPAFGAPSRPERETPLGTYIGWSLVGAGGAALIAGGVFGILALDTHGDFNDTPQNSPDLRDLQDTGNRDALIADVLYGVGGALAVGGVVTLLVLEFSDPSPSELFEVQQAGLTPTDGGAVLSVGGAF